jgi:hypothetical protein
MADEPTKDGGQKTPGSQAPAGNEPPAQDADEWFKEAQGKGFKDKASVWKSYTEAEKKISIQGDELKKFVEFQTDVAPILDIVWNDPEILEKVRSKASGKPTETPKKDDKETPPPPPVDKTARSVIQSQIVSTFEKDTGIEKLDDESKKQVRQSIGNAMKRWVKPGEELPIETLREIFDDALIIAKNKDSKLNKLLSDMTESSNDGAFSSMSSAGANRDDVRLTPEQEKVASRMPGGVEKYKAGLKKLLNK